MSKSLLISLLEKNTNESAELISKIKSEINSFSVEINKLKNLGSNQDLIDQMEADKLRLGDLVAQANSYIINFYSAIDSYESNIATLYGLITSYESIIIDLDQQIANDDLIIALIPPDITKK